MDCNETHLRQWMGRWMAQWNVGRFVLPSGLNLRGLVEPEEAAGPVALFLMDSECHSRGANDESCLARPQSSDSALCRNMQQAAAIPLASVLASALSWPLCLSRKMTRAEEPSALAFFFESRWVN